MASHTYHIVVFNALHDSKVRGANMGPIWGRQDPGGPHVGPMNFAIRAVNCVYIICVVNSVADGTYYAIDGVLYKLD